MIEAKETDTTLIKGLRRLPHGWEWVRLGDAFSIRSGTLDPSRSPEETFTLFSMPAYDEGTGPEILRGREIGSSKIIVQEGDLLLSKLNPRIPRVWLIEEKSPRRKLASTDFLGLVMQQTSASTPYFEAAFARYLFLSDVFRQQVGSNVQGATNSRQRLDREDVLDALLPRPLSLDTQRRIVSRIEAHLADLDEARKTLDGMKRDLGQVMEAALKEVIEDLEKYYPSITLENLISNYVIRSYSGGTPPTNNQKYWNGTIPWVSPKDMKRWYIEDSQEHVSAIAVEENKTKLIPRGSVLLVVRGMILARDLPIGINLREVTINQDMKAFHCANGLVPEYLGYMLRARAPLILNKVEIAGHGTRRLKTETLEQVAVPNAPREVQMQVIAHLDAIQSELTTMQNTLKENDELLKQVEQAILHEAFRGEL